MLSMHTNSYENTKHAHTHFLVTPLPLHTLTLTQSSNIDWEEKGMSNNDPHHADNTNAIKTCDTSITLLGVQEFGEIAGQRKTL